MAECAVTIIIPVLNDALALRRCLVALSAQASILDTEIIVVDGGSDPASQTVALESSARYLTSPRGRAAQMNAGAKLARGAVLWFLHADCVPAPESLAALNELSPSVRWGCFRHRIDAPSLMLRVIERADNFRAHWLRLPYGDQGIFVRRDEFERFGGFPPVPLLEDVMLARTLARHVSPCVLKPLLRSDARRWLERGIVRTTLTNWKILWLHFVAGRTPDELAHIYRGPSDECAKQA
jgi:rSAM/selenodomain-associated transferase 2